MRFLVKVNIPVEPGNAAAKAGKLGATIQSILAEQKPEAAYFTTFDGERTAYFVFDLKDSAMIPVIAEPFFVELGARVEFSPVMNAEDLKTGLSKLR